MSILLEQKLTQLISIPIESLGYELIGIELIQNRILTIRIYIDSPKGVNINNCAEVSEHISNIMDVESPIEVAYNLEVSSPGLERPLFTEQQYINVIGKKIKLILKQPIKKKYKLEGVLKNVNKKMITITIKGNDKTVAFSNIQKANLVPYF